MALVLLYAYLTACLLHKSTAESKEPMVPFLPSLLTFQNGTTVKSLSAWSERRSEISNLLQTTILGTLPSNSPRITAAEQINITSFSNRGGTSSFYRLTFDTSNGGGGVPSVSFEIEVLAPISDGITPPCPLFLTQWNHRSWALTGLSRGYCAVVYPGSDVRDVAPDFQKAYPASTMMLIVARAYVASKTIDAFFNSKTLQNLPKINQSQICITGHSRNGKQSLLAAAFDERITSVLGSSPGAPIASPYHLSSHNFYGEGPDAGQAGHWWLKTIENFAAHPEEIPVDGNGVLSMIAPRRAAIANGWTDHEGDINFADECNVRSVMEVYKLYGVEKQENLRIIHRPGDHHGFDDVNTYFDWFDDGFHRLEESFPLSWSGQGSSMKKPFPLTYLTPAGFSWDTWYQAFGSSTQTSPPPPPSATTERRIKWLLQMEKQTSVRSKGATYAEDSRTGKFRYPSTMMGEDYENYNVQYPITRQSLSFGNYVTGNLFWSKNLTSSSVSNCPTVVWLHPYSYATGYSASYVANGEVVATMTQQGYCVLAFDHIGMGTRINEGGTNFYARYGKSGSLFGRMVEDVVAALDVLECMTAYGRANETAACHDGSDYVGPYLPFPVEDAPVLDAARMSVAGYSLGGNVALHVAALDKRVTHVASFSGFTPFKTDFNNRTTGGLQRLYSFHALLPRLGMFVEPEQPPFQGGYDAIPYDYDELLQEIAPRPILLHTPKDDRDATYEDVKNCADRARNEGWTGANQKKFNHTTTNSYTNMGVNESNLLLSWLDSSMPAVRV